MAPSVYWLPVTLPREPGTVSHSAQLATKWGGGGFCLLTATAEEQGGCLARLYRTSKHHAGR